MTQLGKILNSKSVQAAVIFLAALLPRAFGFVGSTSIWQQRAVAFFDEGLLVGNLTQTLQAPHPGVITMWLAGLARQIALLFEPEFDGLPFEQVSQIELLPIVLVVSLCIVWVYFLLARLFDPLIGFTAALLLALDPYHISLSKAVHVDALVSVFMMVSALLMVIYITEEQKPRTIILSAVFGALALLTKTPAVFMIPYLGLVLLAWQGTLWWQQRQAAEPFSFQQAFNAMLRPTLIWTITFILTYILLWPAMWVQPIETLRATFGGADYYRTTPHENPVFFLGEAYTDDPGALFYPINMAVKTTGIALIGSLLSLPWLFSNTNDTDWRKRITLWLALAFILFFTLEMTLGEKKFARYALPALQYFCLLAGVGWVMTTRWLAANKRNWPYLLLPLVLAIQAAVSIPRHPYYGTHYNYLFGGPQWVLETAAIASGQEKGEGLKEAGEYLTSMPNSVVSVVGAQSFSAFFPYFNGKTVELTDDKVDYIVIARSWLLRRVEHWKWADVWAEYQHRQPKHVIEFDGVPYVWIYKAGPEVIENNINHLVHAQMGETFTLLGYDFEPAQIRPGEPITITLYWETQQKLPNDFTIFTHLLDEQEQLAGQIDRQPQDGRYPTYLWDPGERIQDTYQLFVSPDAPAGTYQFAFGMYELQTGQRLPVTLNDGSKFEEGRLILPGPIVIE